MLLSEIFYSVQGEGMLTGVPSVFVRTSGCNLRCRWCDTPYASWRPEGEEYDEEGILSAIRSWPAARHVVLTGGEPMVARGAGSLIRSIREAGYHLTIETAGTVPPPEGGCDLASLSPKLSNSTPLPGEADAAWIARHEAARLRPEVIRNWMDSSTAYQLKFVVSAPRQMEEIRALLETLGPDVPADRVLLMPEGRSMEELRERSSWLVDVCKATGHRFCHRLHIELFGNTRAT